MEVKIYNSLTKKVEIFHPLKEKELSMYVCGPTVYNHMHIGNARPVVFFDTVRRFFEYIGYQVKFVTNFTDIDDKIIKVAKSKNISELDVSNHYIEEYLKVVKGLNCKPAYMHPRVTECMEEITAFIENLVKTGYAYVKGDDTYFRVHKVESYGMLSNQKVDDLNHGARIGIADEKEDPSDFTLWKKTADDGIKWPSSLGDGRPGWHTECVVMIDKIFGGKIDIHGGGNDLKFPHHENEIAQSMAVHNHPIANYWIHNGRVDLNGEKMSKSVGNVIWVKDLIEKYSANAYRLLILASQYRQNINYSDELMQSFQKDFERLERAYINIHRKLELNGYLGNGTVLNDLMNKFLEEMAVDLNTANAITVLYDVVKQINKELRSQTDLEVLANLYETLKTMLDILGLSVIISALNEEEMKLVKAWEEARCAKNFALADELRNQINEKGIRL